MSAIGGPNVIDDGLVLALDAGNHISYPGSGTVWTDLSGQGNNGTLVNGVGYSNETGGTLVFDGVNDHVDMGDKFNTPAGTISFWIKLTNSIAVPSSQNQRPWGKNGDFEGRWGGSANTTQNASYSVDIAGTANSLTIQNSWSNNIWYNVTLTYNSSANTSQIYVQGILDTTGTAGNPSALSGIFYIGRSSAGGNINGNISQFTVYNRALTASEVLQNYTATKGRYGL
jgi:hypothetical protein